jgi:hypothetical protein
MKKGHLTLVDGADAPPPSPAPRRLSTNRQGQFRLELKDGEVRHILIIVMDAVHGSRLASAMEKLLPATVIDLRQTLRFDQPGSSRSAFFDQLSRIRSTYMRAPIEWSDIQTRRLSADQRLPTRIFHEVVERWEGHIAFLVSKIDQAQYLETILNLTLSERRPDGWDILQVA